MSLAFTRKPTEGFWLEIDGIEPIHVVVVHIDKNRVRLGVVADKKEVRVYRDEVYTRVLQERLNHPPVKETDLCPAPLPLSTNA